MQRLLLVLVSCCVLHLQCFSVSAQEKPPARLRAALTRYDAALLELCRDGRPFERASAVVHLGSGLSPGLEPCLDSLTSSRLEDPLLLTSVLSAIEQSGPAGNRTPALIATGLGSRDPIAFGAAMNTLIALRVQIPMDSVWPPSQAPLLWGDPQYVRWVAGFLSGLSASAPWNDAARSSLSEDSRSVLQREERPHDIGDLSLEALAQLLGAPGRSDYFEILGRIVEAGRIDLIQDRLPKLIGAQTPAHITRGAFALLPEDALCRRLEDGPDRIVELASAELDRRGRALSWRQLAGKEALRCDGGFVVHRRFPTALLVVAALQEGNEESLREQIRATTSHDPGALSWRDLWQVATLAEAFGSASTKARRRTLELLETVAAAHPLRLEQHKLSPDAVYPRALLGVLADPRARASQWRVWTRSDPLLEDLEGLILVAGGKDARALAMRRLLTRGRREGWLPPEARAVEELFPLPQDVGARSCDRLLDGLEPLRGLGELPSAVAKARRELADSLESLYADLLNPRLAADFLQERLSEKTLGLLTLARLVGDPRKPVKALASRLYQQIPPGRSRPVFSALAPLKPKESDALDLAELQAKKYRFETTVARIEKEGFNRAVWCGVGPEPSRFAPSSPPRDFIPFFDPGIEGLFREVARTAARQDVRDASLWALWVGTHDPDIPAAWMRQAQRGSPSERLDALDHLFAARWAPAAERFPPLLDHPLPAFRFRALEGLNRFQIGGHTEKVLALVSDDVPDVAARAMALLAARGKPGALDLLIEIAAHGDPLLAEGASAALGSYHERPAVGTIAASLGACLDQHGECGPLLAAADAAVFHLGDPIGAGVSSFRQPEESARRWIEWWQGHSDDGLARWVRDRYARGLAQFPKEERELHIEGCVALRMFLPIECSNRAWGERDLQAARQWFGAGPSQDVFALLSHVKFGHSQAIDNMPLLWHLDPRRSRSFLVRSLLGPWSMASIRGREVLDLLERLGHPPAPTPSDELCARRPGAVDRWWRWAEGGDR